MGSHRSSFFLSPIQTQNGFKASWKESRGQSPLFSLSLSDSKLKTISKQVGKEVVDSHHSFDSSRQLIVSVWHKDDRPIRFPCRPRFRESGKRPTPPTPQTPCTHPSSPQFFCRGSLTKRAPWTSSPMSPSHLLFNEGLGF